MTNIIQMMKQAKEMQSKMADMQAKLADVEVNGEAGAGMLKVTITGRGEMKKISIDPTIVDMNDLEMLEDLIVAGFNDAKKRADEKIQQETEKMVKDMGLPPGILNGGLPF